jgi:molybdopterin converting factor small subunit
MLMLVLLQVTLLYFASARSSLPNEPHSEVVSLPSSNPPTPFHLSSLRALLLQLHPNNDEFANVLSRSAWSVDEEMVEPELESSLVLKGGEAVCIIPPVSGG